IRLQFTLDQTSHVLAQSLSFCRRSPMVETGVPPDFGSSIAAASFNVADEIIALVEPRGRKTALASPCSKRQGSLISALRTLKVYRFRAGEHYAKRKSIADVH